MSDLKKAEALLASGGYTAALVCGDTVYTSNMRGVKPLVNWYRGGYDLSGFSAADKVVGRATAFLYLLLGVTDLYAAVISRPALSLLSEHGVHVEHDLLVENIINRAGDGICPFEEAVLKISDRDAAFCAITAKMRAMGIE